MVAQVRIPLIPGVKSAFGQTPITSLTDNTGGTADDTLAAVTGSYVQATMANNQADLAAKINAIIVALRAAGIIAT